METIGKLLKKVPYVQTQASIAKLELTGTEKNECCGCNDPATDFFKEWELKGELAGQINVTLNLSGVPDYYDAVHLGTWLLKVKKVTLLGGKVDVSVGGSGKYTVKCSSKCAEVSLDVSAKMFVGADFSAEISLYHEEPSGLWKKVFEISGEAAAGAESSITVDKATYGFYDCPATPSPEVCCGSLVLKAKIAVKVELGSVFSYTYLWKPEKEILKKQCYQL